MDTTLKNRTDTCVCGATVTPVAVTEGDAGPRYHYEHCTAPWWNEDAVKTRCETVDQIVSWTDKDGTLQVEPGDLVLDDGQFKQLGHVALEGESLVGYSFDGHHGVDFACRDDLVAVRRYIETGKE